MKTGFELGREIDSQLTITSFVVPTDHEIQMSDREFSMLWSDESAVTRKRVRIENGLIPDDSGRLVARKKRENSKTVKLYSMHSVAAPKSAPNVAALRSPPSAIVAWARTVCTARKAGPGAPAKT